MGVVYRARQVKADRIVALKLMLHTEHAGSSARARFDIEAQAVARLQHPNIVQVFEVGEVDQVPFFSLEFVAGGTLSQKIKKALLPSNEVARVAATLARTMGYAHRSNIVHRDLKPGNVLLTPEDTPKIADFGLARKTEVDTHVTQAGAVVGTPSYMAPEQASGDPDRVGPAADLYSLGAILYELLTGRPPFLGTTIFEVLDQVRSAEPAAPSTLQPHVSRDLETICLKCLQKDPAQRYASADALAEDLERYQRGEPILARPIGRLMRTVRWCRRNRAATALIAVSLLAALISSSLAFTINVQMNEITNQKNDLAAQKTEILTQKDDLAAKEKLATARLKHNATLVTTFAAEVPALLDYNPFGDEMRADLTGLVVRILRDAQNESNVGTLTDRGLLILATRQGDMARIEKKLDLAQAKYEEALRMAESLVRNEPTEMDKAASNLSFAYIKMGELALDRKEYSKAIDWNQKALALRQRLVDEPQTKEIDPIDCNLDLGRMHKVLAETYFVAKEYDKARSEAQASVELLEKYTPAVRDPKRAELARRDLASAAMTAGNLAFRADKPELGRKLFDQALTIFRRELARNPGSLVARYNLDKVYCEYGDWLIMKLNQPEEALEYFKLAQAQNRALCDSHEVVNVMQMGLALGYYRLGMAAEKAGKTADARRYFSRCLDLREIRVREVEESSWGPNSRLLVDARIDRMLAQARLGQVEEVTKMTETLLKLAAGFKAVNPRNPNQVAELKESQAHYQIFVGEGLAVLAGGVSPGDPRRAEWTAKAVDAVRLAVANDFSNLWFLENDPDFDSVRAEPAYQAILDTMRGKPNRDP
jgi:serine/threonine-protein kinase